MAVRCTTALGTVDATRRASRRVPSLVKLSSPVGAAEERVRLSALPGASCRGAAARANKGRAIASTAASRNAERRRRKAEGGRGRAERMGKESRTLDGEGAETRPVLWIRRGVAAG